MARTLILGGGLAGLATARALGDRPFLLLEREARVGGLCRTEARDGFLFDATGHWLHLKRPEVRALCEALLPDGLARIERRAAIVAHGAILPFPYQTGFGLAADRAVVAENLQGFLQAHLLPEGEALRGREPRTFEEYVLRHLGPGILRNFMGPYNEKLWTVPLSELSATWTGRFVPRPSLQEVVRGAAGLPPEGQGYNASFLYPKQGGIEALPRALAATLPERSVRCGIAPASIDLRARTAALPGGEALAFDALVSTIPLPRLVQLCGEAAPPAVRAAVARLRSTTVTYVNVAAKAHGEGWHWLYFPGADYPFYRVGSASTAWPALAPAGLRSFYVEFSHRGPLEPAWAEREAVAGLVRAGLIEAASDVRFAFARRIEDAYVLYDHAWGEAREVILGWLRSEGIESIGRYGGWEYSSMEDAIAAGLEVGARLAGGYSSSQGR